MKTQWIKLRNGTIYSSTELARMTEQGFRSFLIIALAAGHVIQQIDENDNAISAGPDADQAEQGQQEGPQQMPESTDAHGTDAEQGQGGPEQQGDADQKTETVETAFLKQCADRFAPGTKTRQQIISTANLFADWIKVELSKALKCKPAEAPEKLADWMGYSSEQE